MLPFALLLVVSLWAGLEWHAKRRAFAWDRAVTIRVVPFVAPGLEAESTRAVVDCFLNPSDEDGVGIEDVKTWFETQYADFTGKSGPVLRVDLRQRVPVRLDPPSPETAPGSALERLLDRRRLMNYFRAATDGAPPRQADVVL